MTEQELNKVTSPPTAQQKDHEITVHDHTWNDPYFWLRDKENEEVINYLKAENAYTEAVMTPTKDLQEKIFQEIKGRINETDQSIPTKEDDYFYYTRTEEGKDYKIYCRKYQSMDAEEEILLDVNQLAEDKEYCHVQSLKVNTTHQIMAYSVDITGYEIYTIYFKDLSSGELFDYTIEQSGGSLEWASEDAIYYNTVDDIKRSYRIFYHELHDKDNDTLVYEEQNKEFFIHISRSKDRKFLFIYSHGRESDVVRYINIDDNPRQFHQFNNQIDQVEYNVDHHEGFLYFVTSKDAINFRFCRTRVGEHDEVSWFEIVSHDLNRRLLSVQMFKSFGALSYRQDGYRGIRIFSLPDFNDHTIELPETSSTVYIGKNPNYDTDFLRINYTSLVTPKTVYDYQIETKTLVQRKQEEIKNYDPTQYHSKREFVTARDGTRVPVSISYRKDIKKPAPLLLYGYGSYGASIDPTFVSSRISLLERGVIFVIAHIRGGGEMGKPWYHDGKLQKKMNTFTDFIDTAEYLIETGYTTKDMLSIYGGSAGGLLVGAVTNMRPDLFQAVIARVPFVDVISTMLDDSIPLTTFEYLEWGNPAESKEVFDYMYSYSPYDQLGSISTEYPNMLVMAGLNDPRVHFWEPTKMTAKLRDIKTDDNVLIQKTNMGAGHGGASGRYDAMKETAFMYAFLILALEMSLE